jgi:DNA transposition AAA+ family ATPase
MTQHQQENNLGGGTVAPLTNVGRCYRLLQRAMQRPITLPGMVVMYGPSGFGKSTAAAYCRNKLQACYVECKSTWTKKALLTEICIEMGIAPDKTIYTMQNQISEYLVTTGQPLIIDEMDHLVDKKAVEIIRDIYESSGAPILLIGEERLPKKLERWERFHGRILDWVAAEAVSMEDAAHLARLYCPGITVSEDLLAKLLQLAHGSVRRVAVNLSLIYEEMRRSGVEKVTLADWGKRDLYTGQAPAGRRRV